MYEKPKNRDWVKNAAIIFLAVLLVLTFFWNAIMNRSLPEVATQEVTNGSIVARVRGTGTVTANSNAQVKMEKTRVIRSVLVKVGQQVQPGDVLFTLGEGSSEEIDAAEEKLQTLQASYNKMAATIPDYYRYGSDQIAIANAKEALDEAQQKLDNIEQRMEAETKATGTESGLYTDLQEAEARLKAAKLLRDTAEELYNARIKERAEELEKIKGKNDVQDQVSTKQEQIDALNSLISERDQLKNEVENTLPSQIEELQRLIDSYSNSEQYEAELSELRNKLIQLEEDMETAEAETAQADILRKQIEETNAKIAELEQQLNDPNAPERLELEQQIAELKAEQDRLSFNLQAVQMNEYNSSEINSQYTYVTEQIKAIEDQVSTVAQTKDELSEQLSALQDQQEEDQNRINALDEKINNYTINDSLVTIEELNSQLATLLYEGSTPEQIEEAMHALANVSEADLDAANSYLDKCQLEYENRWATYSAAKNPILNYEYENAKQALRSAQNTYSSLVDSYHERKASNENSLAGYNADLASLWQQIEKAKEKLADLTGDEEAQILARVAGTITSIDAGPGDTKKKDDVLATIEAPDLGYTLSFSVTNEQANRLRPGDTATVSNFYWGTEIVATLNSIKIDQKNPQTNKILTFDLSGNVTAGSELTLSVGQKSANYDIIIPSSSIRTDANGTFVLKVEAKTSPLGNRYIAKRVPVEVLASDDSNSAVSADLGYGDYVITTSTSPLKSGDLVRLATS